MEIAEIIDELCAVGHFPEAALYAALEKREEITPHLLENLEEMVDLAAQEDFEYVDDSHIFAMYLLGEMREKRAYRVMLNVCRLPEHTLDWILGDIITEDLHNILAGVCDGDNAPLKEIIENPNYAEWARVAAFNALLTLTLNGDWERVELAAYVKHLMTGGLEKERHTLWGEVADAVASFEMYGLMDAVQEAFKQGFIDPSYTSPSDFKEILERTQNGQHANYLMSRHAYLKNSAKLMRRWECFSDRHYESLHKKATDDFEADYGYTPPPTAKHTVGPNEPCTCGSGKKYKKCCGNMANN